jgi:hypothetical protein
MKCQVRWVCLDPNCNEAGYRFGVYRHRHVIDPAWPGRFTPDDSDAFGYGISLSGAEIKPLGICADHLDMLPHRGWAFRTLAEVPTPEALGAWVAEVKTVTEAVRERFGDIDVAYRMRGFAKILPEMCPAGPRPGDYYSFIFHGVFYGVEKDGHIHT